MSLAKQQAFKDMLNDNEKYIYIRYFSSESFLGDVQANIGNVVIEDKVYTVSSKSF